MVFARFIDRGECWTLNLKIHLKILSLGDLKLNSQKNTSAQR